jgi:hypothetical protein
MKTGRARHLTIRGEEHGEKTDSQCRVLPSTRAQAIISAGLVSLQGCSRTPHPSPSSHTPSEHVQSKPIICMCPYSLLILINLFCSKLLLLDTSIGAKTTTYRKHFCRNVKRELKFALKARAEAYEVESRNHVINESVHQSINQ